MKIKRAFYIIISLMLFIILSLILASCNLFNNDPKTTEEEVKGYYDLFLLDGETVYEFSEEHRILYLDGKGNFSLYSYYKGSKDKSNNYIVSKFTDELHIVEKGQYKLGYETIEFEWFEKDKQLFKEFEYESNSIFTATYFSNGRFNKFMILYKKIGKQVDYSGTYSFNISESITFINDNNQYKQIIIEDNYYYIYSIQKLVAEGNLLLGRSSAAFLEGKNFYEDFSPGIIQVKDDKLYIYFFDSRAIFSFTKQE